MATHSSILAWRVPWTGKPGGLQSCDHILISKQNDLLNEQILYLKVFPPPLAFFFPLRAVF